MTIAVDFDGVVHRYSRGWQDGTIYDEPMPGALEGLRELMDSVPVFIHTTRDVGDVAEWLIVRQFNVRTGYDGPFWNERGTLLVTNRKLAATAYLDDRAVRFLTWEQALRDLGMRPRLDRQPLPPEASNGEHRPVGVRAAAGAGLPPSCTCGAPVWCALDPTTNTQPKGTAMPDTTDTTAQPEPDGMPAGRCGNDPRTEMTPGDREAVDEFREQLAARKQAEPADAASALARLGRAAQTAANAGPEEFALAPSPADVDEAQLRRNLAQLQDAIARARAPHVKFEDSEHCRADGEPWRCSTLRALDVDEGDEQCPTPLTHNWGCGCPSDEAPAADRLERAERAEAERDGAYRERARLLAWIATGLPSAITPARDVDEDGWWLLFVYPHPDAQLSWHIAPEDVALFAHVDHVGPEDSRVQWDGHNTDEKHERIEWLTKATAAAQRTLKEPEAQR